MSASARTPIATGARIGPYEIVGWLGAGGMGDVYRARDPRLERDVAIKLIPDTFATDPHRLQRFEQEARAAGPAQSPEHPGGLRRRRPCRLALHRLGTARGRIAPHPSRRRRAPGAQGDRLRAAGGGRPRCRARQEHRPPRREARQPVRHERRTSQDPRLRHRQADAAANDDAQPAAPNTDTAARHRGGNSELHVAGTGTRRRSLITARTSSASGRSCTRC